ncbi:S8 family serine peptidase, partial [Microbacterium sp. AISO3]|uniref:S8 family serine peptidase n=1 Tax=Microbacterium sp. AISO3 TaxID=2002831 RepID=UPI0018D29DFA
MSAGNYVENIDIGIGVPEFRGLTPEKKVEHTLQTIQEYVSRRRILSPAESINSITVGALHSDLSGDYYANPHHRTDLLPNNSLFSPISRFGHGFRRSIKPEILFPGGRQLFRTPML